MSRLTAGILTASATPSSGLLELGPKSMAAIGDSLSQAWGSAGTPNAIIAASPVLCW